MYLEKVLHYLVLCPWTDNLPISASWRMELQVCATTSSPLRFKFVLESSVAYNYVTQFRY